MFDGSRVEWNQLGLTPKKALSALVVWKASCPVCRMALPIFDRLSKRFSGLQVLGVCQDAAEVYGPLIADLGVEFEQIEDTNLKATRWLKVKIVPAWWLASSDGEVLAKGESWDTRAIEGLNMQIASLLGIASEPLVSGADRLPAFRPG